MNELICKRKGSLGVECGGTQYISRNYFVKPFPPMNDKHLYSCENHVDAYMMLNPFGPRYEKVK